MSDPDPLRAEIVAEVVAPKRDVEADVGDTLMEVDGLSVAFGGLKALDDVTFSIRRGEILGLIGPNGAGKTTCFNAITGVYKPSAGTVTFDGAPLARALDTAWDRFGSDLPKLSVPTLAVMKHRDRYCVAISWLIVVAFALSSPRVRQP